MKPIEGRLPAAGRMAFEIDPLIGISGDLPDSEEPWYINVCRQRIRGSDTWLTAWSSRGRFHNTQVFGKLKPQPVRE